MREPHPLGASFFLRLPPKHPIVAARLGPAPKEACVLIGLLLAACSVAGQAITTNLGVQADVDIRSLGSEANIGYNRTVLKVENQNSDPTLAEDGKAYIRFQLPPDFGTATSASFTMTRAIIGAYAWTYTVFGLNEGPIPGSIWNELTWPEVNGGNSTNATTWNDAPGNVTNSATAFSNAVTLGTFTTKTAANGGAAGDQYSVSGPALVSFLNADSNGFVTLMVSRAGVSSSYDQWASKENITNPGPSLTLTYTPNTNTLPGNLEALASARWNAWRTNRDTYFTAAWQALYLYIGTSNEDETYYQAESELGAKPFQRVRHRGLGGFGRYHG